VSDDDTERHCDTPSSSPHPEARLAHEIRSAREAAGLTQGQLANRVGFSREYVSRAERPSKGLASRELVEAIDAALGVRGALVTLRSRLHAQRLARRRNPHLVPDTVARIAPSEETTPAPNAFAAAPVPRWRPVDVGPQGYVDELAVLQMIDQRDGPGLALPGVTALLNDIGVSLAGSRGADRAALLRTAARAAEFAGFLHRDLGAEEQCLYWHDRAMEFAQQANDGPMQAYVLLRKAQAAYDQRNALRMLDLTLAAARFGNALAPGLRAEILQQQARSEAMLGANEVDIRHRLDEASTALSAQGDQASNDEPGQHYSMRLLGFQSALCLSEAGRPRDAVLRYREIISPDLPRRDHAYFSILMATSLALSGEPDEAALVACSALPVAAATASRRSIREAHTLVGVLAPWRGRHQVRELHDALRSAERGSAG
jgi:transcriptional regulator with XRE-family HTH domain